MKHRVAGTRSTLCGLTLLGLVAIGGCATEPPRQVAVAAPPPPDTNVYFYPPQGRSVTSEQQDRDRYDCHEWAVQHTGFDPSLPSVPPQQRVQVVAGGPPPGTGVAVGAVAGAVVGNAVSSPWHSGTGTLLGALAGAAIGGAVDVQRTAQNDRVAQANADANAAQTATLERRASDYKRAMSVCLQGRGYIVR